MTGQKLLGKTESEVSGRMLYPAAVATLLQANIEIK